MSPKSIVIVGASADFSKLNGISLRALIDKQYAGALYPVNPKYSEIAGIECHPTVEDVPGLVDLAIVAVPQNSVLESIHALGRKKVAAAIIFSSGFAEVGVEGMRRQAEIAAAAKAGGVRILGPNCLGVVNAFESVMASFAQLTLGDTRGGPFALVTQSGALGSAIIGVAKKRGLHFGYFVATGNECDVGFVEVMEEVLRDPRIKVGAGFIESVRDGPGLVRLASSALSNGRPLVLCKLGRTPAGAKAVASHTGSLAGSDRVFDGICRQYGIVRARHDEQLLDFVSAFVNCPLPEGRRLGVLTRSGGAGALMADRANEVGLEMAVLTEETCERLKGILPEFGSFQNPVDVTGMGMFNPGMIGDAFQMVLDDPHVDVGIIWMGSTREVDFMVKVFLDLRRKARKPFVIAWVGVSDTAMQALTAGTVAVFRGSEPAVDAVAALTAYAQMRRHWEADRLVGEVAASPDIELPMIDGPVPAPMACQILTRWGIHIAPLSLAATADEAVRIAAAVGPPVALKIESPDISHKTEAKGVMLNLLGSEAIRRGFADIISHAHAYSPQARIEGVVVQKMMSGDVELVVGLTNDAVFGAVIMVGLGGILVEVMAEVAIRRAPVTEAQAGRMLHELRGAAILDGVRGKPAVDKKALMRFIATVSCFGAAAGDRLVALDLNPVLVSSQSVVAVDALLVLKNS